MEFEVKFENWLKQSLPALKDKRAMLGFDGFEDRLAAIDGIPDMKSLAEYLLARDGMSGTLELSLKATKMGGNMPIFANALGILGARCDCVGALGDGALGDVFLSMPENCALYPVVPPGRCLALEFFSGKLMLPDNTSLPELTYEAVVRAVGLEKLIEMHERADLLGYFNWSELPGMPGILEGCLRDVFPQLKEKPRIALFDLSDCSRRDERDIREAARLMGGFTRYARCVLSMNENEFMRLSRVLTGSSPAGLENLVKTQMRARMEALYDALGMTDIVVRLNRKAYAMCADGFEEVDTRYVEKPMLMTGAGDNFNAGIAAALLLGADLEYALSLGTLAASFYIENGLSAAISDLVAYYISRRK